MFEYSLDESREDHHILKEVNTGDSAKAVIGIRPCDARAFSLVRLNFDTPQYQDPYWLKAYRHFGPVKEDDFHNFKELVEDQLPDLSCLNTRLSPKSIIYPQSQVMFEYSLDESREDHHILKEVNTGDSAKAVIGIRPCDARAFSLVRLNFDTRIGSKLMKPPRWWAWHVKRLADPASAPLPAAGLIMIKTWMCC